MWLPVMADAEAGEDGVRVALLPVEPDAAVGAEVGAGAGAARAEVPVADAAFPAGPEQIKKALAETMRRLGVTRRASDRAVDAAYTEQRVFQERLIEAGSKALAALESSGRAGHRAGGARIQHVRPRRELRHPAQTAAPLRRQRDPAGFPGDGQRALCATAREHVLDLGPQDSGGRAHRVGEAEPAHDLPDQFQVRAGQLHQALRARGGGRAAAGAAIRRARQRCRVHDALRSVPRQQRNSAMLPIYDGVPSAKLRQANRPATTH